jgi:hypothetical protein
VGIVASFISNGSPAFSSTRPPVCARAACSTSSTRIVQHILVYQHAPSRSVYSLFTQSRVHMHMFWPSKCRRIKSAMGICANICHKLAKNIGANDGYHSKHVLSRTRARAHGCNLCTTSHTIGLQMRVLDGHIKHRGVCVYYRASVRARAQTVTKCGRTSGCGQKAILTTSTTHSRVHFPGGQMHAHEQQVIIRS